MAPVRLSDLDIANSGAIDPARDHAAFGHEVAIQEAERHLAARFDGNFVIIENAIRELSKRREKRVRVHRTGAGARINPDDYRAGRAIIVLTLVFAVAASVASFAGQIAMAPYTILPYELYIIVPLMIDLPVAYLGWMAMIFLRRKQKATRTRMLLFALTSLSSYINILHVLSESGIVDGAPLTIEVGTGALIMGLAPWLVLISWEELTRLVVRPLGEKREVLEDPEPVTPKTPARKPATRKKATR